MNLLFQVTALMSLLTLSLSSDPFFSPPACVVPGPNKLVIPQDAAQENIIHHCARMMSDGWQYNHTRYRLDNVGNEYSFDYKYTPNNINGLKTDTRLWLKAKHVDGTGPVDIDKDMCKRALLTSLNGCAPFTLEPGQKTTQFYKYGGAVRVSTDTGRVDFLIGLVPANKTICLEQRYPTFYCVNDLPDWAMPDGGKYN